jgi:hypothetical protein
MKLLTRLKRSQTTPEGPTAMTKEFVKMLALSLTSVLLLFAAATLSASGI